MNEALGTLLQIVIGAGLLYLLWRALAPSGAGRQSNRPSAAPPSPAFAWPALGQFEFEVVGESHYQPAIRRLAGEHGDDSVDLQTTALVLPDDKNPHDDKAVKVLIDGELVGYLSRDDARGYRRRLATKKLGMVPAQCGALIMGGFIDRKGQRASYGIRLDLKPFA